MATSEDPHEFRAQMERIGGLGERVHIDLMDGDFAPNHNIDPTQLWWPEGVKADIHVMYRHPREVVMQLIELRPHCIILHAEIEDDLLDLLHIIHEAGLNAGVALLRPTPVAENRRYIDQAEYVLLFAGELGMSGQADLTALEKVPEVRMINPMLEIGWDGGANEENVAQLALNGIDVINVGGALRSADSPRTVFEHLKQSV